jgi:hypothetical protein
MNILIRNLKYILFTSALAGSAAFSQGFDPNTRIMDLRDGTYLQVRYDLEMNSFSHEQDYTSIYKVIFNDKQVGNAFTGYLDTHVMVQTNVSSMIQNDRLAAGTYCFDKESSEFGSQHYSLISEMTDRLFFRICGTDEPAFVIYTQTGYNLRNSENFNGFRIRDLQDQVGTALKFVR